MAAQQSVAAVNRSCHVACFRKRRAKPLPQLELRFIGKEDGVIIGANVKVRSAADALAAERRPLAGLEKPHVLFIWTLISMENNEGQWVKS